MKKLLITFILIFFSSIAYGAPIADESVGGILDVLQGGATAKVLKGAGLGEEPLWGGIDCSELTGTLDVPRGGTGATTFTDGGILVGAGTGAVTATVVLGDGTIVVGDGTTAPTYMAAFSSSAGTLKGIYGGLGISTAGWTNMIPAITSGVASHLTFRDEDDMASDDATGVASQQSIKAYVDASGGRSFDTITSGTNTIANMIVGTGAALSFAGGTIDASHYKGNTSPTATEFGYLDGATSNLQSQINGKQEVSAYLTDIANISPLTDDMIRWDVTNHWVAVASGSAVTRDAEDTMTDGANLPDGAAIKAYGDANWSGGSGMVYPGAGIALSTGSAWGTSITDNSANWNMAYTDRLKWDGGATGLAAATGRTSLGLGTAATRDAEDTMTDGTNLPDGAAVKAYGDANWSGTGTGYWTQVGPDIYYNTGKVGIGTTTPAETLHIQGTGTQRVKVESTDNQAELQIDNDTGIWSMYMAIGSSDLRFYNLADKVTLQAGGNVGIGTASPNQKITVEGTASLKEQASANADVAAYGQLWVKNAAPNQLWFTNDAGTDVQLGTSGSGGVPTAIWIRPETYGAITDDGNDDTAAFVSAIAAAAANGQVVKCSAGVYNFSGHFTITSGVHIKGVKAGNYFIDTVPNAATSMDGTVFVPAEILADSESTYFIEMESNSRISELAIYYEGQYTTNTTPKLYPWTLWTDGDVRGVQINDIAVYRAYKFLYSHGSSFTVTNVYGHIIKYGIWDTKGGDTNRFTNVHFQPVHSFGNQWVATDMWVWSTSNGTRAFYTGVGTGSGGPGNSWNKFTNCFAYGFETVFYVDTGVSGTVLDKCGGDFSKNPFYILGTKVILSNCQAVAGDRTITGTQTTAYHAFTLGNSSYKAYNVNMSNCEAWTCSGAGVYLRYSENVNISNQQVISWSLASDGGQWGAVHVSSSSTGTNVFATTINGLSTKSPGNNGASSVYCAGSANYMTVNGCALRGDGKTGTYGLRGTPTGAGLNYANLFIGCATNVSGTWTSSP